MKGSHGVKWQVALTFPLTVATIRPVPPKQGTEPTKVLLNEYPSGRSPLATIVVTPESVVTIVHLAGKDTSMPGTSPGSKKQSSGRSTNAAAEAGAATTTDVATAAASPNADSAIERILIAAPKEVRDRFHSATFLPLLVLSSALVSPPIWGSSAVCGPQLAPNEPHDGHEPASRRQLRTLD
jgi:hypothetical protein